jgi:hypothetical protein
MQPKRHSLMIHGDHWLGFLERSKVTIVSINIAIVRLLSPVINIIVVYHFLNFDGHTFLMMRTTKVVLPRVTKVVVVVILDCG